MLGRVYRYTGGLTDPVQVWQSLNLNNGAWWFGWSETQMYLPQRLNASLPQIDWQRLSLFNSEAELRLLTHAPHTTILLLTEQTDLNTPDSEWPLCEECPSSDKAKHILLGDPPLSGGRTSRLIDVAYPTVFDYGIELEPSRAKRHRVVALVRYYYDSIHRLRYIRYAGIDTYSW
ncbi:MAG: hypothetical protein P3X24_002050 [bacterium]|nr:hypothetical protein [bacterium]